MFQIGLQPMNETAWLDVGPGHAAFMAAKRQRVRGRPPLFYRSLPQSLDAQVELLEAAISHLLARQDGTYAREPGGIRDKSDGSLHAGGDGEPLEQLGQIIEEDFILFEKAEGRDIITAASNAYTSSGRIVSCVGRDMNYAHDPVPGLNQQLGARIDRVLANVKVGAPVVRFNWFVTAMSSRLVPEDTHQSNQLSAERIAVSLTGDHRRAGDLLWVRVERQTFVRLPRSNALAFGIHTYSDPLSSLASDRVSLAAMHRLIGEYSDERLSYSAMLATREPVLRWIEDCLG
jgi:hypothetical protein